MRSCAVAASGRQRDGAGPRWGQSRGARRRELHGPLLATHQQYPHPTPPVPSLPLPPFTHSCRRQHLERLLYARVEPWHEEESGSGWGGPTFLGKEGREDEWGCRRHPQGVRSHHGVSSLQETVELIHSAIEHNLGSSEDGRQEAVPAPPGNVGMSSGLTGPTGVRCPETGLPRVGTGTGGWEVVLEEPVVVSALTTSDCGCSFRGGDLSVSTGILSLM